ncbi:MAG TPA: hypothetical protein VK738_12950 [Terriglobales bacterium]|jgi:hypothetical protein|nr:hypothetical protein [Terriglobales bacterium]
MTDNLEQLEKDWPEPRPKPISAQAVVKMQLATAIFASAVAALLGVDRIIHPLHPADRWVLDVIGLTLVIVLPWLSAIVTYRRIKKVVASGSSPSDVLLYIRYQGVQMLTSMFGVLLLLIMLIPRG